jgi:hypothetical protein
MKFLLASALLLCVVQARPAEACSRAPTCGDEFCRGTTTVIDGTLVAIGGDGGPSATATIEITAVYGDAGQLAPGMTRELETAYYPFRDGDLGNQRVFTATRDANGVLQIDAVYAATDFYVVDCFGPDVPSATMADALLSPSCYETLVPEPPEGPVCPGPYCNAGGKTGLPWVLACLGLVLRRRTRT